ncbi:MAG: Na(+)/H(+) antiporter subunit B [Desulfurococcaceae archaeon]
MKERKLRRTPLIATALIVITVALSIVIVEGGFGVLPPNQIRELGRTILINTYNPWNTTLTSYSLNSVSAIIWDYRGIDTLIETTVLFASVVGLSIIFQGIKPKPLGAGKGMSIIAKTTVKLVILLTVAASLSIAVHGHITPGGGFQGGSILAIIASLTIVAYSIGVIFRSGVSLDVLLKIRYLALLTLLLTAITPIVLGLVLNTRAYVLQNMAKEDSVVSMPATFLNTPLAGSIFFFNLIEYIVVSTSIVFIIVLFTLSSKILGSKGE